MAPAANHEPVDPAVFQEFLTEALRWNPMTPEQRKTLRAQFVSLNGEEATLRIEEWARGKS
jgi:hypothetical protein